MQKRIFYMFVSALLMRSAGVAQVAPLETSGYPIAWAAEGSPTAADLDTLSQFRDDRDKMEHFVAANPNSSWASSTRNALATGYRQSGRNTLALNHWSLAWNQLKDSKGDAAREEANHALAGQLELLSSLGRIQTLHDLLIEAEGRKVLESNDRRRIETAREAYSIMVNHPDLSYRCGSLALANIARQENKSSDVVSALIMEPSTTNGISLARLVTLNRQFGLGLVAVKRTDSAPIPIPSLIHWSQNHYGAILEYSAEIDSYKVVDPTFRKSQWISSSDLDAEASGYLLVPEGQKAASWQMVSDEECATVFGRGYPYNINDALDKGCKIFPTDPKKKCTACSGMPVWWVSEPYISLWLSDEPVSYTTSRGENIAFRLSISQRGSITNQFAYSTPGMMHNWYSKLYIQGLGTNVVSSNGFSDWSATLYLPGGGERNYSKSDTTDTESKTQLLPTYGTLTDGRQYVVPGFPAGFIGSAPTATSWYDQMSGFRVFYPDGSVDCYGLIYWRTNRTAGIYDAEALLTSRTDPIGNNTQLSYECYSNCSNPETIQYRLGKVTDYDGNALTFSYYTAQPSLLSQVQTSYGQTAVFSYDTHGNLTNIVDAVSLTNGVAWDNQGRVTNLTTGYGTTTFIYFTNVTEGTIGGHDSVARAVTIIDANGGTNLYAFRFDCSAFMSAQIASTNVPSSTPLGTLDTGATNATTNFAAISFRNSFHWDPRQCASLSTLNVTSLTSSDYLKARMQHWLGDPNNVSVVESISVEQEPSPDGSTPGQLTFYDYAGKTTNYFLLGSDYQVAVVARLQPSGNTEYTWSRYNSAGFITNLVSTYMLGDGIPRTRTNVYIFATNTVSYRSTTTCTACAPGGQILVGCPTAPAPTSDVAVGAGAYSLRDTNFCQVSWPSILIAITNADSSFVTYGGYVSPSITTSPTCGGWSQTITHSYTTALPTKITNEVGYVKTLFYDANNRLAGVRSSSGLTTTNLYDSSGFLTNTTDIEISRTNSFTYTNGLIYVHQDELGRRITNFWDGLQRLTGAADSEGTISNIYSLLDLTAAKDKLGKWSYFGYDPLRNLIAVTNANGEVTLAQYCQCGALEFTRDAITNYTYYYYDLAGHLTNVVYPGIYSVTNTYNSLDQLTLIADSIGPVTNTYNLQGLLATIADSAGTILSKSFDIMDRPVSVTDANAIMSTLSYDFVGRLLTNGVSGQYTNSFTYTTNGLASTMDALGNSIFYTNDPAGRLLARTNANLAVNQFQYNAAGQVTNIQDGNNHHTYFQYDTYGRLTNKLDNALTSILQLTYDPNGRVVTNWTPATGARAYVYDAVGRVRTNNYPADHSVIFTYDSNGRLTNVVDAVGATAFTYTETGEWKTEDGPWTNDTITFSYTNHLRSNLILQQTGTSSWTQNYSYDAAKRLRSVVTDAGTYTYSFDTNRTKEVGSILLPNAALITNQYDALARIETTELVNYWGHILDGASYGYNVASWRTNLTRSLGITTNSVNVKYDKIGQLTNWIGTEANGAPRANEQLSFGYDASANLYSRTNGALVQSFALDPVNQLTNISRAGTLTFKGAIPAPTTNVTVNGFSGQTYADLTFAVTNLSLADGTNVFTNIATNIYGVSSTNVLTIDLPSSVTLQYDSDGNLTNDGMRSFVYDAENRLTNVFVPNQWRTEFVYDGLRRKRIEKDFSWQGTNWIKTNEIHFIYDGKLVIQERDSNNVPQVTYTRSLDFSGSRQGGGGIGGLLAREDVNGTAFYHSDASGNITSIINGNQNIVARYEYDPFGKLIGQWGPLADFNRYRFSGKEVHALSGLYYFGARFYDPSFQRWVNRDPIMEAGGLNLYGFAGNSPLTMSDAFGFKVGDWYNLATWFWPSMAENEGKQQLDQYAKSLGRGFTDYDDALSKLNAEHDPNGLNSDIDYRNQTQEALNITAGNASDLASTELNAYPMMLFPAAKGEEATAQAIADASQEGWLSKWWNKIWRKCFGKKPKMSPGLRGIVPRDLTRYARSSSTKLLTPGTADGTYAFVQDIHGNVWVADNGPHMHPQILGDATPVASAGEITIQDGNVSAINNISGTFRPDASTLNRVQGAAEMQGMVVNPNAIQPFQWPK